MYQAYDNPGLKKGIFSSYQYRSLWSEQSNRFNKCPLVTLCDFVRYPTVLSEYLQCVKTKKNELMTDSRNGSL